MHPPNFIVNSFSPYSFQGQEHDDEVKGEGNSYTTFYRQHDTRLGRWLSSDPKASAWESLYSSMGNNPIINFDFGGDKFKGIRTKAIVAKYETNLYAQIAQVNLSIGQENAKTQPDPTKILALSIIQLRLNEQIQDVNQLKSSKLVYRIKKSDKYPGSEYHELNQETSADGEFGVDQVRREGLLLIHPEADNFNITMSQLVTKASMFDKGEIDLASDLYNDVTLIEGKNLFDRNDLSKILKSSTVWEQDITSPQLFSDVVGLDNIIETSINRSHPNIHSENRSLNGQIPGLDENGIDGSKGSIGAQGSLTFNDWLHSPAFSPLQTVIYDDSKNILNVPSSSQMRTNSNSVSNSIKLK